MVEKGLLLPSPLSTLPKAMGEKEEEEKFKYVSAFNESDACKYQHNQNFHWRSSNRIRKGFFGVFKKGCLWYVERDREKLKKREEKERE